MRISATGSRFFCALGACLALLVVGACTKPEPPVPDPVTTAPTTPVPDPDPLPPEPEPSVPESVVGSWCGGQNDAPGGHWTYIFSGDGSVAAENREGGFSGYVVTQGDVMIFHVEGSEPFKSTWSVSYEEALGINLLFLDDYSYVPGPCTS
ncbi:hypothetical protein GCM10010381_63770 [Streptomyces xantholiticus]|nr:hypothetical protein GCM10010381_63770 [Streptomyces xantholiticus]